MDEKIKKPGRLYIPIQDPTGFDRLPYEDRHVEEFLYFRRPCSTQKVRVFRTSNSVSHCVDNSVGEDDLYFFLRGLSEAADKTRPFGSFTEHRGLIINFIDDHTMTVEIYDDYKE